MWKNIVSAVASTLKTQSFLLPATELQYEQVRTTFILKRKFAPLLHKKGKPKKSLRSRHYVYDLVKDTTWDPQPNVELVLTSFVKGYGNIGEKVSVKRNKAYINLLLPGLAVYANPDNIAKYKLAADSTDVIKFSSATAAYTLQTLSQMVLSVVMNKENPWTLQRWHIKASFRKCGYVVPEEAITIPEKPISGPDMNLENKEFIISVLINKKEKVDVRCRIHHWSTEVASRLPHVHNFWEQPAESIFSEQASILEAMPKKLPTKNKVKVNS